MDKEALEAVDELLTYVKTIGEVNGDACQWLCSSYSTADQLVLRKNAIDDMFAPACLTETDSAELTRRRSLEMKAALWQHGMSNCL